MVGTRGGGGGVTEETRGNQPGVPLNKSIGDGTPGTFGRAGGPGVRVGGLAVAFLPRDAHRELGAWIVL